MNSCSSVQFPQSLYSNDASILQVINLALETIIRMSDEATEAAVGPLTQVEMLEVELDAWKHVLTIALGPVIYAALEKYVISELSVRGVPPT
jgi:hypothetical protein